jgi:predicted lipid carrier protein YhbT
VEDTVVVVTTKVVGTAQAVVVATRVAAMAEAAAVATTKEATAAVVAMVRVCALLITGQVAAHTLFTRRRLLITLKNDLFATCHVFFLHFFLSM